MKRSIIFLVLVLSHVLTFGQGIIFNADSDWDAVLKRAKKENKYIFIDCYATWCAPCKRMDKEVFENKEVGEFINAHYISLKLQFDSTANDSEAITKWRNLTKQLKQLTPIDGFPTYLFFSPEGKIIGSVSGSIFPYSAFLQKVKEMQDPSQHYFGLRDQYLGGDRSDLLVLKLLPEAIRMKDADIAYALHDRYIDVAERPLNSQTALHICATTKGVDSKGYKFILANRAEVDSALGDGGERTETLIKTAVKIEVRKQFLTPPPMDPDWEPIRNLVNALTPLFQDKILMELKYGAARDTKQWEKFGRLKMDYYDKYGATFSHNDLFMMNNQLMEILVRCSDKKTLLRAAKWSKVSINRDPAKESYSSMDTYANLLYKAGNRKEAIQWQEKALKSASADPKANLQEFAETLAKMKKGVPSWPTEL